MSKSDRPRIGIFTPASPIGQVELQLGVHKLEQHGYAVKVHEQSLAVDFLHAGTHRQRADALWDLANDDEVDVIWCARGGYGCNHLLPLLDDLTLQHGRPPRKRLVGYSDVTILHHYTATRWGWDTLHANMPATGTFLTMAEDELNATFALVNGTSASAVDFFPQQAVEFLTKTKPTQPVTGPMIGGNLAVFNQLTGTAWQLTEDLFRGALLFVEDLNEGFYRIDSYFTQLAQSGVLGQLGAIVLGDFQDCTDEPGTVVAATNCPADQADGESAAEVPLRPSFGEKEALRRILVELCEPLDLPVLFKVPVGHGPNFWPLPLYESATLHPDGRLTY